MNKRSSWWQAAAIAAATVAGGTAVQAHELACEKTVNGQEMVVVDSYPATLHWSLTVTNTHPTDSSTALTVDDPMLDPLGFSFPVPTPFTLGVGESTGTTFDVVVNSPDDCAALAANVDTMTDGLMDDATVGVSVDNTFYVTWDLGAAQCSARVVCMPQKCTGENCGPGPETGGATRTMGFFKTHESATQQCLDQGPVNLGNVTITTLADALGLLWGSPVEFADGTARSNLDQDRFLLDRQLFVGICNQRLFGTAPVPSTLFTDAIAALSGTNCNLILTLEGEIDAYNNSGDNVAFPSGFMPGPATPQDAKKIGVDPTTPSGMVCQ